MRKPAKVPPPIALQHRDYLTNNEAAYYLRRTPKTLRNWTCEKDGPIKAVRVAGRFLWATADIRRLLELPAVDPAETARRTNSV